MDPQRIHHYLDLFETLRRQYRWKANTDVLRFTALTLATVDVADPVTRLVETTTTLQESTKWSSPLRSPIRYSIAAMIVRRDLDPSKVIERIEEVRAEFRARKVKRGGTQELLAALILALNAGGRPVREQAIQRVKDILDRWKQDHRWLTGWDDYPMAALHASRDMPIEQIGRHVEEIYQGLRKRKYSLGNQLQLSSHLLAISMKAPLDSVMKFTVVADALRGQKVRIGPAQYDEVALLTLTERDPGTLAREVVAVRDELMTAKPKPIKSIALSLSAGLILSEVAREDPALQEESDLATVKAAQAILEAQQAAMVAVIASTSAATTAATSG